MKDRTGAVITGGDFQGLGVLRTLAKKNIPVALIDSDHCIGRFSRYKKRFFRSPCPSQEEAYVEFLIRLAKTQGVLGWVIFPNSDETVYVLSRNRNVLQEYYRIPTPDWEVIRKVYVKKETYQLAEKHGIPAPRTRCPEGIAGLLNGDLQFPVVVKPSIRDRYYSKVRKKAYLAKDTGELLSIFSRVCRFIPPSEVLVQEFIRGGPKHLYSFCPFFKDGKSVAAVMARRTRQHPMDFGHATTFAEIVHIPELQKIAEKFLGLIGYSGIAEVEFMLDKRDGRFKLIEVNPRVWGWHSLAIEAGVDLPYYQYQDLIGEKIYAGTPAESLKWVRLLTDTPTVFLEVMKGNMKLREYFSSMKGNLSDAVLCLDDPLPFFVEVLMLPYLWAKRGF